MMPDPGSPWERENPNDGFGYLPWPIKSAADQAAWNACEASERRAAMFNQFLDSLARKAGGV